MVHRLELLSTLLPAAGCAATNPTPAVARVDDAAPAMYASFDVLEAGLARAKAEQRDALVLIAPTIRCCAEPGRLLTPALDLWRKDAELQSFSSRFVVVELTEESMYAFFERCVPEGTRVNGSSSAWPRNPWPMPGAYRLNSTGNLIDSVALDDFDAREQLLGLLAN